MKLHAMENLDVKRLVLCEFVQISRKQMLTFLLLALAVGFLFEHLGVIPIKYRFTIQRCDDQLGCFAIDGDFSLRMFNVLPQDRSVIDTKFVLYEKTSHMLETVHGEEFSYRDIASLYSSLDMKKEFIFVIHGWWTMRTEPVLKNLVDSLTTTKSHTHNIVLVDWSKGSFQAYQQSASNTRVVGAEIAQLLSQLQSFHPDILARVHLIGISLGAHIAGYCGAIVPGIARITALDAAGPLFEHFPESIRLDPSDALFVDAIHTDGDDLDSLLYAQGGLGIHHSIGHADFYPNGGLTQPYCSDNIQRVLLSGKILTPSLIRNIFACDHELSLNYFAHSLYYPTYFLGFACVDDHLGFINGRCNSTNFMGYAAVKPQNNHKYYLHMSGDQHFQGFHYQVLLELELPTLEPVCITSRLIGSDGVADHIKEAGYNLLCTNSTSHTAMLFSEKLISNVQRLALRYSSELVDEISIRSVLVIYHQAEWYRKCSKESFTVRPNQLVEVLLDSDCSGEFFTKH